METFENVPLYPKIQLGLDEHQKCLNGALVFHCTMGHEIFKSVFSRFPLRGTLAG